jgi:peptide/nickel transport system permease protein
MATLCLLARYVVLATTVLLLNFAIPRWLPGESLGLAAGDGLDSPLAPTARARLRAAYRLDRPLDEQLSGYLGDLVRGDLGWSIARAAPVRTLILDRLPWTLGLVGSSLLLAAVGGTVLGLLAGWFPGGWGDWLLRLLAGAFATIPEFLVATGVLVLFAIRLGWFPIYGGRTPLAEHPGGVGGLVGEVADVIWHLTLPAAALVLVAAPGFLLLARDVAAGIRREPWLIAARAKGLDERAAVRRHAWPNVAPPLLTFFGLRLGALLGGALVVERVFGLPGLGSLAYQAIRARDVPVLQALFLVTGLGMLSVQLAVEFVSLRLSRRQGPSHA